MSQDPFEYNWVDGAERIEKYRPGGYHPVNIGDTLHHYQIVDKLGFGGYSTIWLARDKLESRYVALKVGIANSSRQETTVLRALAQPPTEPLAPLLDRARDSIPIPLDEFDVHGPNGTHPCYAMTPAQCDLRTASFSRLFPIDVARSLSAGLAVSVAYMHARGYVHGDLHLRNELPKRLEDLSVEEFYQEYGKPEKVPITRSDGAELPPNVPPEAVVPLFLGKRAGDFSLADCRILLGDFGEAFSPSDSPRLGEDCHAPVAVRPPEASFESNSPLLPSADVWSLATAIWEILGMKAIFSSEFVTDDQVTSQQIDVLGPLPEPWWERWDARSTFFQPDRRPQPDRSVWSPMEQSFEEGIQKYRRKHKTEFGPDESHAILDLLRQMLRFEPDRRLSMQEVLESEWMVKWALPEFERTRECARPSSR